MNLNYLLFIIGSILLSDNVSAQNHYREIEIGCLNLTKLKGDLIIEDESDYYELYSCISPHTDCSTYQLPEVNFDEDILLGIDVNVAGCGEPSVQIELLNETGNCHIVVKIKRAGMCKALFQKRIWLLVSKSGCNSVQLKKSFE